MPIFNKRKLPIVLRSVEILYERAILHHRSPSDLSTSDIYKLMVKPEDVPKLFELERQLSVMDIVGLDHKHSTARTTVMAPNGASTNIGISMMEPIRGLLPAYSQRGFHDQADPKIMALIDAWVIRRYDVGRRFSTLSQFVNYANMNFSSLAELKYYFDGITGLLGVQDDTKDMANRSLEMRVPAALNNRSREIRDTARDMSSLVSWSLLFPQTAATRVDAVVFSISKNAMGTFTRPWGGTAYVW